jgi:hypothetical protein
VLACLVRDLGARARAELGAAGCPLRAGLPVIGRCSSIGGVRGDGGTGLTVDGPSPPFITFE